MNLDFETEIIIAIVVGVTICVVVKYCINFYLKLKEFKEKKQFNDLFTSHIRRMPGSDFDIDKENAENAEKQ